MKLGRWEPIFRPLQKIFFVLFSYGIILRACGMLTRPYKQTVMIVGGNNGLEEIKSEVLGSQ
jgi:hypothetical protein